jgi:hypothetical protein
MITEPDVTLTDYGLALECSLFTYLLHQHGDRHNSLRAWFILFFGSVGLAALAGGTVHGFLLDAGTVGSAILWPAVLIATGLTALSAWAIGAKILFPVPVSRWISLAAAVEFVAYSTVVLLVTQEFWLAVINYLPALLLLLVSFCAAYGRTRDAKLLVGSLGLTLTFVASWIQQSGIALHPTYFNHNALYHLIQAGALFITFWSARWLVTAS